MPQAVAMERRNVMESRSRPKWRSHFGMPPGAVASGDWGYVKNPNYLLLEGNRRDLLLVCLRHCDVA